MPLVELYMWNDRPQTPGRPDRRIYVPDRHDTYKWDTASGDWVVDGTILSSQTIALAKITPTTGTDGTITVTNGVVTAYTAPT